MTLKNAMAELPPGGGKAVLFRSGPNRQAALESFEEAVECLDGRYIIAGDVGTSVADMTIVRLRTRHVAGLESDAGFERGACQGKAWLDNVPQVHA